MKQISKKHTTSDENIDVWLVCVISIIFADLKGETSPQKTKQTITKKRNSLSSPIFEISASQWRQVGPKHTCQVTKDYILVDGLALGGKYKSQQTAIIVVMGLWGPTSVQKQPEYQAGKCISLSWSLKTEMNHIYDDCVRYFCKAHQLKIHAGLSDWSREIWSWLSLRVRVTSQAETVA